jgi:CCR4-NOT transcription complex subunit 1
VVTNDNLELACSVVERVAMDKAISEVDEGLAAAYGARRKHREKTTAPWESMGLVGSRYSNMLPDPLRMKLNGLLPQQMQVYEDFGNLRAASAQLDMPNRMGTPAGSEDGLHLTQDGQLHGGPLMLTVQQAVDKFNHIVGELDTALASETAVTLSQLPASSDIAVVLTQLPVLAARSLHTDETALACAQKVVQLLYRAGNDLAREAYATLLESLCSLSEKVIREVMAWLVYAEDEARSTLPRQALTDTFVSESSMCR